MVHEYYKNADDLARQFDGWFQTGDIVELIEENRVRVIDRRKSMFKLSQVGLFLPIVWFLADIVQGEFVSPQQIEGVLQSNPVVSQVFVTCASSKGTQEISAVGS